MIATTINAQTKTYLSEKELAKLLQALTLSEEYIRDIYPNIKLEEMIYW